MKVRTVVVPLLLLVAAGGAGWAWTHRAVGGPSWRTAVVERGDVRSLVSATGTVEAVDTVDVGTQVSGIVSGIFVDFNDRVVAGQRLARIDPTLLQADVSAAEARLASARATEQRGRLDLARSEALRAQGAATEEELEVARADDAVAVAEVRAAEVALARARRNLDYTEITSPIAGTVVRRDVEVGQTVNAGFSAPTLFVVVGDLARLRVLADVDEADIGRIAAGQHAAVTVTTWPDTPFPATVERVRLQSELQDNVVTYPVEVAVENPDGKLLPGMTATVEFTVAEAVDVLCAPNAALRFSPEGSVGPGEAEAGGRSGAAGTRAAGSSAAGGGAGGPGARRARGRGAEDGGTVWTVGADGALEAHPVTLGLRGATCTEVRGEGLVEGLAVVVGADRSASGEATSPFSGGTQPGGFRGGGF